jgi:hypothetical protein
MQDGQDKFDVEVSDLFTTRSLLSLELRRTQRKQLIAYLSEPCVLCGKNLSSFLVPRTLYRRLKINLRYNDHIPRLNLFL